MIIGYVGILCLQFSTSNKLVLWNQDWNALEIILFKYESVRLHPFKFQVCTACSKTKFYSVQIIVDLSSFNQKSVTKMACIELDSALPR